MPIALVVLGLVLQLAGVAATARGATLIWRDIAAPGETLTSPAIAAIRHIVSRCMTKLIHLFRTPRPKTIRAGASAVLSLSAKARGYKNFRELPADVVPADAIAELDDRTREMMERLGQLSNKLADEVENRKTENSVIGRNLRSEITEQAERERRRAVTGIRYEALGLLLLTLGSLLNFLGTVAPQ